MPPARRIAVMVDPDHLGFREEATLRGIARYAQAAGWSLLLDPFAVQHPPADCHGMLAPPRRWTGPRIRRSPVPVVCIAWSGAPAGLVRVVEDRGQAGRLAARHLLDQGYRTFAYLGFSRHAQSAIERTEFSRALRRLGRHPYSARTFRSYARTQGSLAKVRAALGGWLERLERPIGLFVAQPGFARILAQLALGRGLRIPHDLGIIAADDAPVACELPPALTSLHFDYALLGYRAAELLDRLIDGAPRPPRALLIEPTLVPRESTDRQALRDPLVAGALRFIDERRTEPLRPADVAAGLRVAQRTLQRRFRRAGRDTVQTEILKARVEHAKLDLAGGNAPLPAVARDSGFGSVAAMARAFRRHVGMAPIEWRRQAHLRRRGTPSP